MKAIGIGALLVGLGLSGVARGQTFNLGEAVRKVQTQIGQMENPEYWVRKCKALKRDRDAVAAKPEFKLPAVEERSQPALKAMDDALKACLASPRPALEGLRSAASTAEGAWNAVQATMEIAAREAGLRKERDQRHEAEKQEYETRKQQEREEADLGNWNCKRSFDEGKGPGVIRTGCDIIRRARGCLTNIVQKDLRKKPTKEELEYVTSKLRRFSALRSMLAAKGPLWMAALRRPDDFTPPEIRRVAENASALEKEVQECLQMDRAENQRLSQEVQRDLKKVEDFEKTTIGQGVVFLGDKIGKGIKWLEETGCTGAIGMALKLSPMGLLTHALGNVPGLGPCLQNIQGGIVKSLCGTVSNFWDMMKNSVKGLIENPKSCAIFGLAGGPPAMLNCGLVLWMKPRLGKLVKCFTELSNAHGIMNAVKMILKDDDQEGKEKKPWWEGVLNWGCEYFGTFLGETIKAVLTGGSSAAAVAANLPQEITKGILNKIKAWVAKQLTMAKDKIAKKLAEMPEKLKKKLEELPQKVMQKAHDISKRVEENFPRACREIPP